MQLYRGEATFGKLNHQVLKLQPGLNIITAPNETGKSTWCAFLLSMFYGINRHERDRAGFIAEKNHFQPWNGAPMSGRLDLCDGERNLTLLRTTKRPNAPMADFQITYTGTATPIPNLDGEALLGVSREVFERSCFIRQSSLSITQNNELERRIASLIATGEEDTSFSEAYDSLKKQLNRRQYNKTGQIPALESDLSVLMHQISEARSLQDATLRLRTETASLASQIADIDTELEQHRLWELSLQQKQRELALSAAQRAREQAKNIQQQLTDAKIPDSNTIHRMETTLDSLQDLRIAVKGAEEALHRAEDSLESVSFALDSSPYAGQSETQVRAAAPVLPPQPKYNPFFMIAAGVASASSTFLLIPGKNSLLSIGIGVGCIVLVALLQWLMLRPKLASWKSQVEKLRQQQREAADEYCELLNQQRIAQADVSAKRDTFDVLSRSLANSEAALLAQIQHFAPNADSATAARAIQYAAQRRKSWEDADQAAQRAEMRYEIIAQQNPVQQTRSVQQPTHSKEALLSQRSQLAAQLSSATSDLDQATGRLDAIGNLTQLETEAAQKQESLARLRSEYSAIKLAMETLESANATLQNRFSPELGRRATEIFHRLTGGIYQSVTMDRNFHLSARPKNDLIDRSIQFLSVGAADQLYLAVRLAICDLVLPSEKHLPIILDDALANFDDTRCALALDYLKELSADHQIILFSCHSREADYFAKDEQVSVQQLTNPPKQV